ncbi:Pre-mRNA 3' end processing protein WDR33 [Fasciola hepatica]|uniref:Pre-mRNA 3' end processing protein WDR33 n=1 Tax=Fasciola hepatica TaxID=6192 RepID=A0A4E0RZL2_FASHE|nr:Pre-mRNA 3' end processing protein WDR33 [Fasciola hepatica]
MTATDCAVQQPTGLATSDARKSRKAVFRRTIDYNASVINYVKERIWLGAPSDRCSLQPDYLWSPKLLPPRSYLDSPMNCVMSKPVRTSTNKNKCPIYCVCVSQSRYSLVFQWTPEGRRLITGAYSGEFTLWNGLTFNFETILQAHESQIRCMKWSHNEEWLLTADHSGYVKYWQANMNNVEMYQAHKEPIRGVRYAYACVAASCPNRGPRLALITELLDFVFLTTFQLATLQLYLAHGMTSEKYSDSSCKSRTIKLFYGIALIGISFWESCSSWLLRFPFDFIWQFSQLPTFDATVYDRAIDRDERM